MIRQWRRNHPATLSSMAALGWMAAASLSGMACSGESEPTDAIDTELIDTETIDTEAVGTDQAAAQAAGYSIDPRRSLAITDQQILARFPLQRVLDQIIATSGVWGLSSVELFQQWWDTQNPGPGLDPAAPHCDDATDGDGNPLLNGYPYVCRPGPAEGEQASCDPFAPDSPCAYAPIGLFMRFDAAPEDGSHCGEYRIVYAKESGRTAVFDRNLAIFEAAVRNPLPHLGLGGCRKLVRAWADLSYEPDIERRAAVVEKLYFRGLWPFDPIVHWRNYGGNAAGVGQVRTNQFVQTTSPKMWSLRELKLKKQCSVHGCGCTLRFVPVTNKSNPFGPLFDEAGTNPNAAAFRAEFLTEVERLAAPGVNGIGMSTSDVFNSGQSQAANSGETNYLTYFGTGPSALRDGIQDRLTALGSPLTPDDIVRRAQAMSCAGCHRLSSDQPIGGGLTWPASLGFTHVSERDIDLEAPDGVTRYRLSPALENEFLPHRKQIVEAYLNGLPLPPQPPQSPLGGHWTH